MKTTLPVHARAANINFFSAIKNCCDMAEVFARNSQLFGYFLYFSIRCIYWPFKGRLQRTVCAADCFA